MQCSKCGHECATGVSYCKSCGAPLVMEDPASSVPRIAVAWKCGACGMANGGQNKFCRKCGASCPASGAPTAGAMGVLAVGGLEQVCPACGKPTTAEKPFCKHCGFRLTPAAAAPAPTPAPAPVHGVTPPRKSPSPPPPPLPARSAVPVPEQWTRPTPAAGGSSASRKTWLIGSIAAAALVVVAVIGAVIYFSLHRQHPKLTARPAPAVSSRAIVPAAPVARAASSGPGSTAAAPSGPIPTTSIAAAASPSAPTSTMTSPQNHAQANSTAAASALVSKAVAAPVLTPAPTVATPAKPSGPTHTQLIAMRLTDKAEAEYRRQNFTAAIANCKAALDLWPGYRHARQLLQQSEQAQQAAMNSIKIH